MAETTAGLGLGKASETGRTPMVFETYFEAHQEAVRRCSRDAANGMFSRVESSPYGGYVVRSWPIELLTELDMWGLVGGRGRVKYQDL